MKHNVNPLGEVLRRLLCNMDMDTVVDEADVRNAYNKVVGEFVAKLTRKVRYDAATHTLYVTLASAALKQEVSLKRNDLMKKINETIGREVLRSLVIL